MVEWLAGNRIRGTSTERTSTDFNAHLISPSVGGWKELGRTTLGSSNTNIDVASLADKRYLMWLCNTDSSGAGNIGGANRVGNSTLDTGSNYSDRYSENGASDATRVNRSSMSFNILADEEPRFYYGYISNIAGSEKLMQTWSTQQLTLGAGNPPNRGEWVGKWANTSNVIDTIRHYDDGGNSFATGSELVVLGWDPDDTHTTNFWEQLASISGTATGSVNTGTFTAKKYLWIQVWVKNTGSTSNDYGLRTGNTTIDSNNNYALRYSNNGGSDATGINGSFFHTHMDGIIVNESLYANHFMINNSANEKLVISHTMDNSAGTGSGNSPSRKEAVQKWITTGSQANIFEIYDLGSNENFDYEMKVWGSN